MDSRQLFKATDHLKGRLDWVPSPNYGWHYCGRSADLEASLIDRAAAAHFSEEQVYFVPDRRNGLLVERWMITGLVAGHIDRHDVWFWSEDLRRAMHFASSGVFRFGVVS